MHKKILICGFAGAGKTTLLNKLEETRPKDWKFIDLDKEILKTFDKSSISEFVSSYDWNSFREKEEDILSHLLSLDGSILIALGGGALKAKDLDNQQNLCIHIKTSLERCLERIKIDGPLNRPAFFEMDDDEIANLYAVRMKLFSKCKVIICEKNLENIENWEDFLSCIKCPDIIDV